MLSFEYTAIDRQGNSVSGQIQAATRDEAALNLTRTGLLVSRLSQAGAAPIQQRPQIQQSAPPLTNAPVQPGPPPKLSSPPQQTAGVPAPVSLPKAKVRPSTPSAKREPVRTRPGTDKDIYFVFSQLQSYAQSGSNPVQALTNVGNNCPRKDYGDALLEAADAAKEGRPISEVFERYVDLFPPHVVGMVRAAEQGGFFPEAYGFLTDQAHASHKFRIWFKWLLAVAIMVGACLPLTVLMVRAALDSWDVQEKTGGAASGWGTLFSSIGHEIIWPTGPVILALVAGFWSYGLFWKSLPRRPLRHRLALLVPSVNKRARSESLSVFAWTLANLSKVGLAPKTVWELAVGTVPNLAIKQQLGETGQRMGEQTRLSEAMTMSQQMPDEYAPIVQTGEVTGDVPGALMRASQSQLEEFKASDQASKVRVGCWMLLLMVVGSLIMFAIFYKPLLEKFMPNE
jgi:type II secretory pathway component PulF